MKAVIVAFVTAALAALTLAASVVCFADQKDEKKSDQEQNASVKADKPVTPAEEAKVASIYGAKPYIVEQIEISGEINDATTTEIQRAVENVNDNPRIKAVVLTLNSPGGGAAASAASYEELAKIKVPVVAWCDQMCASGAYYIAMSPSVKYIAARREAIVGSVGVIMHLTRYHRLLDKLKIDSETYASGSLKDSGDPMSAGSDAEKQYLQSIVTTLAKRFYAVVAKARPKIRDWDAVKTGRIFIAENGVGLGLVDGVSDLDGAIKKAKQLSGKKTIFTRDEMRKMSQIANETEMRAPTPQPKASVSWMSDLHQLVGLLMEVKSGQSAVFEYRLPIRF